VVCLLCSSQTSSSYEGASINEVDVAAPQNQQIWCREGDQDSDKTTSVKCYYKDQIAIFRGEDMKFGRVRPLSAVCVCGESCAWRSWCVCVCGGGVAMAYLSARRAGA
jgi:hypothetical protein